MALLLPSKTSTTLLFLPSLLLLLLFSSSTADPLYQICGNTGNYTAKSTYQSNLDHLLSSLTSTNSSLNVSSTATSGQAPDQIYGLALCRGDANSSACLSCLATARQDIQLLCPYNKDATIWYDGCQLRYSNQQFLSSPNLDSNIQAYLWNTGYITSGDERSAFNQSVKALVTNMSQWAAYKSNTSFATAEMNFSAHYPKIYGLAQCAGDLSRGKCSQCLNDIANFFATNSYFEGRPGGRILGIWCNARYEVDKFYDGTSTLSLASLPVSNSPAPTAAAPVLTPPPAPTAAAPAPAPPPAPTAAAPAPAPPPAPTAAATAPVAPVLTPPPAPTAAAPAPAPPPAPTAAATAPVAPVPTPPANGSEAKSLRLPKSHILMLLATSIFMNLIY